MYVEVRIFIPRSKPALKDYTLCVVCLQYLSLNLLLKSSFFISVYLTIVVTIYIFKFEGFHYLKIFYKYYDLNEPSRKRNWYWYVKNP